MLTFGSLFSGVGGLDLGLEQAGHKCAWHVEADPFCRQVLARHWPNVPQFGDVREVGAACLPSVDMIVGGFPCQDISSAGRRAGIGEGTRSGLWFEFARLISELHPSYVLIENVEALRYAGRGLGRVLQDLSARGYDTQWDCLPAAAFGAAHLRDRIFVFAWDRALADTGRLGRGDALGASLFAGVARTQFQSWQAEERMERFEVCGTAYRALPEHLRALDGLSDRLDEACLKSKERRDIARNFPDSAARVKACGNAVAPPVAHHVGRCITNWLSN